MLTSDKTVKCLMRLCSCHQKIMHWGPNLCRICGQMNNSCHEIYNKDASNNIEDKIRKCLKLELFKDDFKPKQLCNPCLMKLEDLYAFLTVCEETDRKFDSILLNRQEWPSIEYNSQQKLSVIVSAKSIDQLDCSEIDLYKDPVLPLGNCAINDHEILEIDDATYTNLPENLDYLNPYTLKKSNYDFYQESTVLRHSSNYQESCTTSINYSCQQDIPPNTGEFPELNYPTDCLDYSNYAARDNVNYEFIAKSPAQEKSFPCPHCDKKFKRRGTLNAHIAIHTKVRPYICDICKKSFAIKSDLTNHQKIHTDLHKCKYCSSSFVAPSKLERHLRTHTKVKPFICDYKGCNKSFSDKRNLVGHKLIHSNEFNFSCANCPKKFRTKNQLKQHLRAHASLTPYKCDVCLKAYKYKSTLILHMKKHNGYFCPYCKNDCQGAVKLIKHKKSCANKPKA